MIWRINLTEERSLIDEFVININILYHAIDELALIILTSKYIKKVTAHCVLYLSAKSCDKILRETMWSGKNNYAMVCGQVIVIVYMYVYVVRDRMYNQASSIIGRI